MSIHLSIHLSIILYIYPPIFLTIYLSICLSVYLSILFQINNELDLDIKDDEIKCLQAFSIVRDQLISDLAVNHNIHFNQVDDVSSDDYIYDFKQSSMNKTTSLTNDLHSNNNNKSTLEFFFFEVNNLCYNMYYYTVT